MVLTFFLAQPAHSKTLERISVIVNNEIILLSEIDSFQKRIQRGGLVDDSILLVNDAEKLKKNKKAVVDFLVDEKIIDSIVKRNNLQVTIERVEKEIRTIAKGFGISRSQLKQSLKNQGVSFSEYQDFVKRSLERQILIEREVRSKIRISDEEISDYYLQNSKNTKQNLFEYSLAHILFLGSKNGVTGAKERSLNISKRVSTSNFEDFASRFSEDTEFTQGGFLGDFKENEMNSTLLSLVKDLKPGSVSKPVKLGNNYHIIKVLKKTLIPNPELLSNKERIRAVLFQQAMKQQLRRWLDEQKQLAFIKVNG